MKKIFIILFFTLLLFSCSNEDEIIEKIVKQDFYIETKNVSDFWNWLILKKTWKISSSQDIALTSQILWRVKNIYVKEWEQVKSWDIIAKLDDNIANYWLSLERAKNILDKLQINYETTENSLNKKISDIKIGLKNLKFDNYWTRSSLELDKINNSIKKIAIDYENLKIANLQTISWFKNSWKKDLTSFTTYLDDVIDFSDKLLGITSKNKNINDSFEDYLWAKDSFQLKNSKKILVDLIDYRNNYFNKINYNFEWYNWFDENNQIISNGYIKISSMLNSIEETLDNSIDSIWSLSESKIAAFKWNIDIFWSSYYINNGWFVALKNTINSFLDTFENWETSLLKQIWLLEDDKKIYIKSLDISLELDESTLKEAISNKNLTLRELDTVIVDAGISYRQVLNNYKKLTIRSPITGSIWKILINVWQEIRNGSDLFNISNNWDNEIIISVSKDELDYISVWDIAYVNLNNNTYTGSIYSISNIADSNLNYLTRVSFPKWLNFIWDIVNIDIPYSTWKKVFPINIIKVYDSWKWTINVFSWWTILQKTIKIWNIFNDKIEINEDLDSNLQIIMNYIDNYDSEKFNLIEK